ARAVANNDLRRALRGRLHAVDAAVANRALRAIVEVRHPGFSAADLRVARSIVLREMRERELRWLSPQHERVAGRLWVPGWEAELRDIARMHGPDRAAARALLATVDRQRAKRRPGP